MGTQRTAVRDGTKHERKGWRMTRKTLSKGLTLAVLSLGLPAPALAQSPTILRLANAQNAGPLGRNDGPGAEQPSSALVTQNGKQYVVTVWMSSQVAQADRPYQCKCSSVELDPLLGPQVRADAVQLTRNRGNRPCNHPKIASNGDFMVMTYGTNDPNRANVATYVQAIDAMCNILTPNRVKISQNNNNNEGAPDIVFNGGNMWTAGYLSTGGNNRSIAVGLNAVRQGPQVAITPTYNVAVVAPANIGRPSMTALAPNRTMFCAAKGDNRPPEVGVVCAILDTANGNRLSTELVAASNRNATPRVYMNSPQVSLGTNGRVHLVVEQSTGGGRNGTGQRERNGQRGSTKTLVYTLETIGDRITTANMTPNIGVNQVHATSCSGKFGTGDDVHVAVFDASITGSGLATAQMIKYDVVGSKVDMIGPARALGAYAGDSGLLANLYGQNPNNQGRDFMRCIGDVPNPGFGNRTGFRPDVKSFFVFPYAGMVPGEPKNSLFLSFLPAQIPVPEPPRTWQLAVSVSGDGAGSVASTPTGIDRCLAGMACNATYDNGVVVSLTPNAIAGSEFVAWSGDCIGSATCVVRMDRARAVTATFTKLSSGTTPMALGVTFEGDGRGSVTSSPAGLDCLGSCSGNFDPGARVTLLATAMDGSRFGGWRGDCFGMSECSVTLDTGKTVFAKFIRESGPTINPTTPTGDDNPAQRPAVPGAPVAQGPAPDTSVGGCTTTGNNSGAFAPVLLLAGLVVLVSRRRR